MKRLLASLTILLTAGCATPSSRTTPEATSVFQDLKSEKIAVKYTLATKRIYFSESLYRVFWITNQRTSRDFSGVWEPDSDLSEYTAASISGQGYNAVSAYKVVTDGSIIGSESNTLTENCFHAPLPGDQGPGVVGGKTMLDCFMAINNEKEFLALSDNLKNKGYKYLLELRAEDLSAGAPGFGTVSMRSTPYARLVDLTNNKVVWTALLWQHATFQLSGDLRKLEVNEMSKTKEGLRVGINKINFAALWAVDK